MMSLPHYLGSLPIRWVRNGIPAQFSCYFSCHEPTWASFRTVELHLYRFICGYRFSFPHLFLVHFFLWHKLHICFLNELLVFLLLFLMSKYFVFEWYNSDKFGPWVLCALLLHLGLKIRSVLHFQVRGEFTCVFVRTQHNILNNHHLFPFGVLGNLKVGLKFSQFTLWKQLTSHFKC